MIDGSLRPLVIAGIVLGIGMGGFIDGILFHQLLQMHNMLSAKYPPTTVVNLEVNMFWDGIFHVVTWLTTALGIFLLWRTVQSPQFIPSGRALLGAIALGWGLFNLVEGIVNHHILHLHHVREVPHHLPWDIAFLVSGVVLSVAGLALIRSTPRAIPGHRSSHRDPIPPLADP